MTCWNKTSNDKFNRFRVTAGAVFVDVAKLVDGAA